MIGDPNNELLKAFGITPGDNIKKVVELLMRCYGFDKAVTAETSLTGNIISAAGIKIPVATPGDDYRRQQNGQPLGISTKSLISPGKMFRDFSGSILGTVTAPDSTVTTNYTGYDGSNNPLTPQSKTGQPYMTKIAITNDATQQFEISNANLGAQSLNGTFGMWVYADLAGKVSGTAARIFVDFFNTTTWNANYTRAQWAGNQLRHGWNFLVFKQIKALADMPASEDPLNSLTVTKGGSGADTLLTTQYLRISCAYLNGCTIYLDSLWSGFSSKPVFILGADEAANDTLTHILPVFQQYGWRGYVAAPYRQWISGSKLISDWSLTDAHNDKVADFIAAGWDVCNHGVNHLDTAIVTVPSEIRYEVIAAKTWLLTKGAVKGSEFYISPKSSTSILAEKVISACGFVLQRHGLNGRPNIHVTQFGIDNENSVGSYGLGDTTISTQKFSDIKQKIDANMAYGASTVLFWHSVTTVGDTGSGEDLTGNDYTITKSALLKTLAYIKALEDAGSCRVADGFTGWYYGTGR